MAQKPALTLTPRRSADPEPDLTSLLVIHRAIRKDLARLTTLLDQVDARNTTAARRRAIRRYAASLLTEIRLHHAGEDDIVWPVIQATAGQAIDLTPLTDDHHGLEALVAGVELALPALTGASAETTRLTHLRTAVRDLRDMLDEHIADEEAQIVPVIRQYMPAESYAWCVRRIMQMPSIGILRFGAPWVARFAGPHELARLLAAADWTMRPFLAVTRPGYRRLERRAFAEMDGQKIEAERVWDR